MEKESYATSYWECDYFSMLDNSIDAGILTIYMFHSFERYDIDINRIYHHEPHPTPLCRMNIVI